MSGTNAHAENESALSVRWLRQNIGLTGIGPDFCGSLWVRTRDAMRSSTQIIGSLQDWISDFWLCRNADAHPFLGVAPRWDPPDELDEWPALTSGLEERYKPEHVRRTNHVRFTQLLGSTGEPSEDWSDAAREFFELNLETMEQADPAMVQAEHVRAWLATALGNLLSSIALSPNLDRETLIAESRRRLLIPRELRAAPKWGAQFLEGEIGILYNCRKSPLGSLSWRGIRVGQGEEWLKHWDWLSHSVQPQHIVRALRLAARLLRCRPLLDALLAALSSADEYLLALAVVRRWVLSLKAMSWLEDALAHRWRFVRPQDLACFAFNAVKPDWPRRSVALSHRSMDAKPTLQTLKAWRSSLFAIDANYAPSWETNTGMVWGLFATTPILARVRSPNYGASEWCERESEMIDYLEQTCDFMRERGAIDIDVKSLSSIDRLVDAWRPKLGLGAAALLPEFPPLCTVYTPNPQQEWPLQMLRAAAALRIFHTSYGDARIANGIAHTLLFTENFTENIMPVPSPTNNVDGWAAYRKLLRDLHRDCGCASGVLPLQLPADAPPWHLDEVLAFHERIPDLGSGSPVFQDVLAAIEWLTVLLPLLEEASMGDMILIDLRGMSRETWETQPSLSLTRGIAALRMPPRPLWFIQFADQRVDDWELRRDRPIFTQYTEGQFAWMFEGSLSPDWPDFYAERCGLVLSPELREKCRETRSGR